MVPGGTVAATTTTGAVIAGGTGDNMGGALGMALEPGDFLVSIGTNGVILGGQPGAGVRRVGHRHRVR